MKTSSNKLTTFYLISGIIALLCIASLFIPVFLISYKSMPFLMIFEGTGLPFENTPLNNLLLVLTKVFSILSVVALAVCALLAFLRKAASGIVGIISSVFYCFVSSFWVYHITSNLEIANNMGYKPLAFMPFLMLAMAVGLLILSVVLLIKRKK